MVNADPKKVNTQVIDAQYRVKFLKYDQYAWSTNMNGRKEGKGDWREYFNTAGQMLEKIYIKYWKHFLLFSPAAARFKLHIFQSYFWPLYPNLPSLLLSKFCRIIESGTPTSPQKFSELSNFSPPESKNHWTLVKGRSVLYGTYRVRESIYLILWSRQQCVTVVLWK